MKKIQWVNFIHIYQPPWQREEVVRKVMMESYDLLLRFLKHYPHFHVTLNIAGTLLDSLTAFGYTTWIKEIAKLVERGQVELTGSSHFHAFLPQLPEHEITRQVRLQQQVLRKHFPAYTARGFFLPEMAYSQDVGDVIKKSGYQWIILDPMSMREEPQAGIKYIDRRTGLTVIFRNRRLSKSYPPEEIYKLLKKSPGEDNAIITATDGELYGHFHQDWQQHLEKILRSPDITILTVSEYLRTLHEVKQARLREASWETKPQGIKTNNPFTLWYNQSNPIHRKLWKLAHTAIELLEKNSNDQNYGWARYHLDRGLASCSFWWASGVKTSVFAPLAWNPDEIERGALELIKSIRSLNAIAAEEKIKAEKIYLAIVQDIWTKHWKTYGSRR